MCSDTRLAAAISIVFRLNEKKPTRIAADYIDEKVGLDWANKYNQKSCSDSATPKLPRSLLKSCVFSNSPRILVGARRSPHALRSDDATSAPFHRALVPTMGA